MRSIIARSALASVALGGALIALPAPAGADELPPDWTSTDQATTSEASLPEATAPAPDPNAPAAGIDCGQFPRWQGKVTTTINPPGPGSWTIDLFKDTWTPGICENNTVLTNIYATSHTCEKYGWGVVYSSHQEFRAYPTATPYTKTGQGEAECTMKMGGSFKGVNLSLKKTMVMHHSYKMSGKGAQGAREGISVWNS